MYVCAYEKFNDRWCLINKQIHDFFLFLSVVEGVMGKVNDNTETKTTAMEIHISRQVHAKSDMFYRRRRKGPLQGTVHVPIECEVSRGTGIFLFMGRVRFDRLHLTCAPYLNQWKKLLDRVRHTGALECSYDWTKAKYYDLHIGLNSSSTKNNVDKS